MLVYLGSILVYYVVFVRKSPKIPRNIPVEGVYSRERDFMTSNLSRPTRGGPGQNPRILPAAAASGLFSAKICVCSDRVFSLCFVTFTEILSSQNFFPRFMDMSRKDFRVPGPGDIA